MKVNTKELLFRIVVLMIGLTIAHLGVTLFILADLGSDPFNVLVQGIFRTIGGILPWSFITHGRVHIVICFLIILALLVIDKSYVKIGTILCMIFGGPIIDMFTVVLAPLFAITDSIVFKLVMLALGCVILAYGMTIVIKSDAGTGPNDLVSVVISDKLKNHRGCFFRSHRIFTWRLLRNRNHHLRMLRRSGSRSFPSGKRKNHQRLIKKICKIKISFSE